MIEIKVALLAALAFAIVIGAGAFWAGVSVGLFRRADDETPTPDLSAVPPPPPQPEAIRCVLIDDKGGHVGYRTIRAETPPQFLHRYHGRGTTVTFERQKDPATPDHEGRIRYRQLGTQ